MRHGKRLLVRALKPVAGASEQVAAIAALKLRTERAAIRVLSLAQPPHVRKAGSLIYTMPAGLLGLS